MIVEASPCACGIFGFFLAKAGAVFSPEAFSEHKVLSLADGYCGYTCMLSTSRN